MLKHKCHSTDKAQFIIKIGTEISVIRLAVISFITTFTKWSHHIISQVRWSCMQIQFNQWQIAITGPWDIAIRCKRKPFASHMNYSHISSRVTVLSSNLCYNRLFLRKLLIWTVVKWMMKVVENYLYIMVVHSLAYQVVLT